MPRFFLLQPVISSAVLPALLSLALLGSRYDLAQAQDAPVQTPEQFRQGAVRDLQRKQYIEITSLLRAPAADQKAQMGRAYQLFSEITDPPGRRINGSLPLRATLPANSVQMSVEDLADSIVTSAGSDYLSIEAKASGRELLRANLDSVEPLIRADLQSTDTQLVNRGLTSLYEISRVDTGIPVPTGSPVYPWLGKFYDDVTRIFVTNPLLERNALKAIGAINDPRAIGLLIAKDPMSPTHYFQAIAALSQADPKNAALLSLLPQLESADPQQRFESLYALSRVDAAIMRPHVEVMLNDLDPQVRCLAVNNVFRAGDAEYNELKSRLVQALDDPDEFVRFAAATGFFRKHDAVANPTLLRLLKSDTASSQIKNAVAGFVKELMGDTFVYVANDSVPPQLDLAAKNNAAIALFEKWIQDNPVKN